MLVLEKCEEIIAGQNPESLGIEFLCRNVGIILNIFVQMPSTIAFRRLLSNPDAPCHLCPQSCTPFQDHWS